MKVIFIFFRLVNPLFCVTILPDVLKLYILFDEINKVYNEGQLFC